MEKLKFSIELPGDKTISAVGTAQCTSGDIRVKPKIKMYDEVKEVPNKDSDRYVLKDNFAEGRVD